MIKIKKQILFLFLFVILQGFFFVVNGQISSPENIEKINIDYYNPVEYTIGGITVSGTKFTDDRALIMLSGLTVGDKITLPGDKISEAIDKLWKQKLFGDIKIYITRIKNNNIFLEIALLEKPRLSKFKFEGLKKSEIDDARDKIKIKRGDMISEHSIIRIEKIITEQFVSKGFLKAEVIIIQKPDTSEHNAVLLKIVVKKNNKIKVNKINVLGNNALNNNQIKSALKETKEKKIYRFWKKSIYIEDDYKEDKTLLINKYYEKGYRDARIIHDTIYKFDDKTIDINIKVDEGNKYYFRNIIWVGNTKYSSEQLSYILRINKGDVYNQKQLEENLFMNADGTDVSSLYLDDGYLFFNISPIEVSADNDSIDIEMRIFEGKQARINKVFIVGNTKTNDHVIMREIRTKPGQLFNRSDIIRTQRELAQLRYFDQEKLGVNPKPNPAEGTVDIEYVVEETSSDQVELSGGFGAGRVIGTLGVSFNNFSTRNFFKKGSWTPLPAGDGQKLSLRAQSNGLYYQAYNASFTEPWLGGKKPNSLSFNIFNSLQNFTGLPKGNENRQSINIRGISIGLGQRIKWPDDFFTIYQSISFQQYNLTNYSFAYEFNNGYSNNLNYSIVFGRNSVDAPIFARRGSDVSVSFQSTLPYYSIKKNILNKDFSVEDLEPQDKFKWTEYHKWKFSSSWFSKITGNLVLNTRFKFGFLGYYNKELGMIPFERFFLGGDGLSGYALDGREVIALRGYGNQSLTPKVGDVTVGGTIYNKYTMELRYPVSLNPMATVYVLGFLEAGNSWLKYENFNAFDIKRSAGIGVRVFLPMFGLLGLDWGYGFDDIPGGDNKSQFHFSIGQSIE